MKTILLTGFGDFPGAPENPTATVVADLASLQIDGVRLITRVLPVIWRDAQARIDQLIEETKPDAILHLGLATQRRTIGVETRAQNQCTKLHPDAENICRASGTILPEGPGIRRARIDCAQMVDVLRAAGLDAELSDDAGDYICNHTLYLTLGTQVPQAGFIHLPYPDERMSLSQMESGIAAVLRAIAQAR